MLFIRFKRISLLRSGEMMAFVSLLIAFFIYLTLQACFKNELLINNNYNKAHADSNISTLTYDRPLVHHLRLSGQQQPDGISSEATFTLNNDTKRTPPIFIVVEKLTGSYELKAKRYRGNQEQPIEPGVLSYSITKLLTSDSYVLYPQPNERTVISIKSTGTTPFKAQLIIMERDRFNEAIYLQGAFFGGVVIMIIVTSFVSLTTWRISREIRPTAYLIICITNSLALLLLMGATGVSIQGNQLNIEALPATITALALGEVYYSELFAIRAQSYATPRDLRYVLNTSRLWFVVLIAAYLLDWPFANQLGVIGMMAGVVVRSIWMAYQRKVNVWAAQLLFVEAATFTCIIFLMLTIESTVFKQLLMACIFSSLLIRLLNLRYMHLKSAHRHIVSTRARIDFDALSMRNSAKTWAAELGTMLRGIGHDLSQPASSFGFIVGVMKRLTPKDDPMAMKIQQLELAQQSQEELIKQLSTQINSYIRDTIQTTENDVNIYETLYPLIFEYRARAFKKGISIRFVESKVRAKTNPAALRRFVRNALDNAFKHCANGKILVGVRRGADGLRIQIWDTGPGLENYSKAADTSGTQIGNTIMLDLMKSLDAVGTIRTVKYAHGPYPTGAKFELSLPYERKVVKDSSNGAQPLLSLAATHRGYILDVRNSSLSVEVSKAMQKHLYTEVTQNVKSIVRKIDDRICPSFVVVMVHDTAVTHPFISNVLINETRTRIAVIYVACSAGLDLTYYSRKGHTVIPYEFAFKDNIVRTIVAVAGLSSVDEMTA